MTQGIYTAFGTHTEGARQHLLIKAYGETDISKFTVILKGLSNSIWLNWYLS